MLKIRNVLILLGMLLSSTAFADVHVNIGINVPLYPDLVVVPGYPVYYAPQLQENYFFYDGVYWVYQDDNWYASSWYNGPWDLVDPEVVPVFVLRIPVSYYRRPPSFFVEWRANEPPHWGEHWGHDWERRRNGWDRWDHNVARRPAPLPVYQREYSGDRYPQQVDRQRELHQQNYHYQPRSRVARQEYQGQTGKNAPAQQERQKAPEVRGSGQRDSQRASPNQQAPQRQTTSRQQDAPATPRSQSPQRGNEAAQKPASAPPQQERPQAQDRKQSTQPQREQSPQRRNEAAQKPASAPPQQERPQAQDRKQPTQPQPGAAQREQQTQGSQGRDARQQGKDTSHEPKRGQGQEQGRGQDRNE